MSIETIAEAIIYKQHGWAVAEQFESTWDNQSIKNFLAQNETALEYIYGTISELIEGDLLSEDAIEELEEYLESMDEAMEYLNSENEGPEYDSAGFTKDDRIVNGQYRVNENKQ